MNILGIKKLNQNIWSNKKEQKKSIWESLPIFTGIVAATIPTGVEKWLIWEEKLQKILEIFRKVWDNKKNLVKRHKYLFDIG